jgi:hypothetical protein
MLDRAREYNALVALSHDTSPKVRQGVADRISLALDVLERLLEEDESHTVRASAFMNPGAPEVFHSRGESFDDAMAEFDRQRCPVRSYACAHTQLRTCPRGSMRGVCFALINEEKRSLLNQHKQAHPTAITTCSVTVEFRPRDGKERRWLTPSHLLSHTKAGRRWPDLPHRDHDLNTGHGTRRRVSRAVDGKLPSLAPARRLQLQLFFTYSTTPLPATGR